MSSESRRALLTGLTGQDGSFLAELLLEHGYDVVAIVRRPTGHLGASEHLRGSVDVIEGDLLVPETLEIAIEHVRPHELYHLAAPTFVPASWERPAETLSAIAGATATLLDAVARLSPSTRMFFAGSSEMFGDTSESPQREDTPCRPRNPYATAKLAAHQLVGQMRAHSELFACSGILYNHESERRPEHFVTRKVSRTVAAIKHGLVSELILGDLDAVRDWSFAGDVALGAWLMLQREQPGDYILASGIGHTVRDLLEVAFGCVGLDPDDYVRIDPALVRSRTAVPPVGDPSRARVDLGWLPTLTFDDLVTRMVTADLDDLARYS